MLLPHVEAYHAYYIPQYLLQRCTLTVVLVGAIKRALDYDGVEVGEHLVLLKHHGPSPRAVVDSEVKHPLVRRSLAHIIQKLLQILLILEHIFVKVGHLCDAYDFTTLLQEDGDADVLGKSQECVQVAKNLLVGPLLVKLFEMLPVALEWTSFNHLYSD